MIFLRHITPIFPSLSNKSQRVSKYDIVKERNPVVANGNRLSYIVFAKNNRTHLGPETRRREAASVCSYSTMTRSCFKLSTNKEASIIYRVFFCLSTSRRLNFMNLCEISN